MQHTHYCISTSALICFGTGTHHACTNPFLVSMLGLQLDQHQQQQRPGEVFRRLRCCFLEPPSPAAPTSSAHWLSQWLSAQPHSPCCLLFRPPCPWPAMRTRPCCLCPALTLSSPSRLSPRPKATLTLAIPGLSTGHTVDQVGVACSLLAGQHAHCGLHGGTKAHTRLAFSTHGRHLLHGVGGHDAEDDGDSRVQARAQHAAGGRTDNGVKVRRGAPHLRAVHDQWTEQLQAEEADTAWTHVAPVTPIPRAVPALQGR